MRLIDLILKIKKHEKYNNLTNNKQTAIIW